MEYGIALKMKLQKDNKSICITKRRKWITKYSVWYNYIFVDVFVQMYV